MEPDLIKGDGRWLNHLKEIIVVRVQEWALMLKIKLK